MATQCFETLPCLLHAMQTRPHVRFTGEARATPVQELALTLPCPPVMAQQPQQQAPGAGGAGTPPPVQLIQSGPARGLPMPGTAPPATAAVQQAPGPAAAAAPAAATPKAPGPAVPFAGGQSCHPGPWMFGVGEPLAPWEAPGSLDNMRCSMCQALAPQCSDPGSEEWVPMAFWAHRSLAEQLTGHKARVPPLPAGWSGTPTAGYPSGSAVRSFLTLEWEAHPIPAPPPKAPPAAQAPVPPPALPLLPTKAAPPQGPGTAPIAAPQGPGTNATAPAVPQPPPPPPPVQAPAPAVQAPGPMAWAKPAVEAPPAAAPAPILPTPGVHCPVPADWAAAQQAAQQGPHAPVIAPAAGGGGGAAPARREVPRKAPPSVQPCFRSARQAPVNISILSNVMSWEGRGMAEERGATFPGNWVDCRPLRANPYRFHYLECKGDCGGVQLPTVQHPALPLVLRGCAEVIAREIGAGRGTSPQDPVKLCLWDHFGTHPSPAIAGVLGLALESRRWNVDVEHLAANFNASYCSCARRAPGTVAWCKNIMRQCGRNQALLFDATGNPLTNHQMSVALNTEQHQLRAQAVLAMLDAAGPIFRAAGLPWDL